MVPRPTSISWVRAQLGQAWVRGAEGSEPGGRALVMAFCLPEDVFLLQTNAVKSVELYALFSTVRWARRPLSSPDRGQACTSSLLC